MEKQKILGKATVIIPVSLGDISETRKVCHIIQREERTGIGTNFSFEEKTLGTINRLTGYAVRALIIVALLIGSSILCTTSAFSGEGMAAVTIVFRSAGLIGFVLGLFFAQRLVRNMKKGK